MIRIGPSPPVPYVVHQPSAAAPFVNRDSELQFLSNWAAERASGSILTILSIGGMGKTSLAWEWFAGQAIQAAGFEGRMWWSFYEGDASSFFLHCYSYITGLSVSESNTSSRQLVDGIIRRLQEGRFLLVLDGFERQLIEYAPIGQFDAATLATSHLTRRAASFDIVEFLRRAAAIRSGSKVVLTSRLAPADLEDSNGNPTFGTRILELNGFDQSSTRQFFSQLSIVDHIDELVELAATLDYHPLAVSLLARQVAIEPGSLARLKLELQSTGVSRLVRTSTVLRDAIDRLGPAALLLARHLAAFSEPVKYSTLATLLIGKEKELGRESELDRALSRLQDVGLVAWNQEDNTYSMHPVVRGAILNMSRAVARS